MHIEFNSISTGLLVLSSGLGTYLLALRFRDAFSEKPDPKLTYSTIKQLDHLSQNLKNYEQNSQKSIHDLRLEVKSDNFTRDNSSNQSLDTIHSILRKVIQDTAKLTAQNQITQHRLSELSLKSDKLLQIIKN